MKKPAPVRIAGESEKVQWGSLFLHSGRFLLLEHGFRLVTEEATRHPGIGVIPGYAKSLGSMHGWADGDEFYVNYVGHPMQGAVAGYIWARNDPRYANVEFGANRDYWRSRLRATAFSFAYSAQFEIGLFSEASIGAIQSKFPQQGFVDLVVTPSIGMAWMIGEDALDRYIVRWIERKTTNKYAVILARGGFNPSRSLANMLTGKVPWARMDRAGVTSAGKSSFVPVQAPTYQANPPEGVPPVVVEMYPRFLYTGDRPCMGGGATAGFRLAAHWQFVADVAGCKMIDVGTNWSGDSLTYMFGPRWSKASGGRWNPYLQFLVGGQKLTQELMQPALKAALVAYSEKYGLPAPTHDQYTEQFETNGFMMATGTGIDYNFNSALALRVADISYTHSWASPMRGYPTRNGMQLSMGMVLKMGTW